MAKVKKLYINVNEAVSAIPAPTVFVFNVTQITNGTLPSDSFGNFLQERAPSGSSPAGARSKDAVAAWFQGRGVTPRAHDVRLDFISATAPVPAAAPAIDPLTTRFFRLRLAANRIVAALTLATLAGTVYVARQHTIEA